MIEDKGYTWDICLTIQIPRLHSQCEIHQVLDVDQTSAFLKLANHMILVSERHCPVFGRNLSYLPKICLNRKNVCFLFKEMYTNPFLPPHPGADLCSGESTATHVWLSSLLNGLVGLLEKTTP
jgi:hypothetical protein